MTDILNEKDLSDTGCLRDTSGGRLHLPLGSDDIPVFAYKDVSKGDLKVKRITFPDMNWVRYDDLPPL